MVRVDVTSFATDPDLISIRWLPTMSVTADEENCLRHVIVGVGIPVATQVILIVPPGRTRVSAADNLVTDGATEHYVGYTAFVTELLYLFCDASFAYNANLAATRDFCSIVQSCILFKTHVVFHLTTSMEEGATVAMDENTVRTTVSLRTFNVIFVAN